LYCKTLSVIISAVLSVNIRMLNDIITAGPSFYTSILKKKKKFFSFIEM